MSSAPECVPGRITVPVVEWDLDTMGDLEPGAITVDVSSSSSDPTRVWFLTRQQNQHLYRLTVGPGQGSQAQFRSWMLDASGGRFTGGLKKIRPAKDKRFVFVKTVETIQQVDTQCTQSGTAACSAALKVFRERTAPGDESISDLAIDSGNNVYTTAPFDVQTPEGYVQRLNPKAVPDSAGLIGVTRWKVGGVLGFCNQAISELGPCLSGIDLDEKNQHLVYFSHQGRNSIGELNTSSTDVTKNVRYWSLDKLASQLGLTAAEEQIFDPRQLKVVREYDKTVVWVVTGSGHVVRLIPQSGGYALMSAHRMPDAIEDPFGVAPDNGTIGYTSVGDSEFGLLEDPLRKDKVGMLLPEERLVQVPAVIAGAPAAQPKILVTTIPLITNTGFADADKKKVEGRVARNRQGDTFVDAFINRPRQADGSSPSFRPMGITPDYGSKVGTFFYAVGITSNIAVNRIGRAFLPPARRPKHARDDDDFDGDGKKNKHEDTDDDDDGTPNQMDRDNDNDCRDDALDDDDDDNDGNDDKWDDPRKKETRNSPSHTTPAGGSTVHQMMVPAGATLAVAQVTAADLTTPLRIEIIGPTGLKLAAPLATPGVAVATVIPPEAGTYTVRVTNLGTTAASLTTDLIVQETWPVLTSLLP